MEDKAPEETTQTKKAAPKAKKEPVATPLGYGEQQQANKALLAFFQATSSRDGRRAVDAWKRLADICKPHIQ